MLSPATSPFPSLLLNSLTQHRGDNSSYLSVASYNSQAWSKTSFGETDQVLISLLQSKSVKIKSLSEQYHDKECCPTAPAQTLAQLAGSVPSEHDVVPAPASWTVLGTYPNFCTMKACVLKYAKDRDRDIWNIPQQNKSHQKSAELYTGL